MGQWEQVLILEVECALDKHAETPGGKYRRDTPWLVEAFRKQQLRTSVVFITSKDSAASLTSKYPNTAFLGRVTPMDYPGVLTMAEYDIILEGLKTRGVLIGPMADHMNRLGSKMILYEVQDTSLGTSGVLLHKLTDMKANKGEIDQIIPKGAPPRVLKMLSGSYGQGVWKLENKEDSTVLMTDAYTQTTTLLSRQQTVLEPPSCLQVLVEFCKLSNEDAISMPFLPMIKEGEYRFLMSKDKILAIVHKKPIDKMAFAVTMKSGAVHVTLKPETHKALVSAVEEWARHIQTKLQIDDIPFWWTVDCIQDIELQIGDQILSTNKGRRLVLSEINCSCIELAPNMSKDAKIKGMRFAERIAQICLNN